MSMDWANERYVRVYIRDTPSWLSLSFPAQGLFCLLLRKVSRAGILELGKLGHRGVFIAVGHGHQGAMLEPALEELLADGCVQINGDTLVIPNFLEAQETPASDAQRSREHRGRVRDGVVLQKRNVTPPSRDPEPRDADDTKRDASVTKRDKTSRTPEVAVENVTPSCAVPSVPPMPSVPAASCEKPAAARKTVMGPKSVLFVRACAVGLGHPIAPLTDSTEAGELEARVLTLGGPEAARDVMANILRRKATDPQSARLLLDMLREVMPKEASA